MSLVKLQIESSDVVVTNKEHFSISEHNNEELKVLMFVKKCLDDK